MIIPALHRRQHERGYLTSDDLRAVAAETDQPLYRVQQLVSFFPHFRTAAPAKIEVHVCRDMSCHLRGSGKMIEQLEAWANEQPEGELRVCGVSCLGRCDRAVAAMINESLYVQRSAQELRELAWQTISHATLAPDRDSELADAKIGKWRMDYYEGQPRYEAVHRFVKNPDPDAIIKALEVGGLLGMGGAGGRAFKKWQDVREASGREKYIVCNADESEPGTFKDREILLAAPHCVIEGMILGGLVVGAERGWVYVRHEYPEQIERVEQAIEIARSMGALGNDLFGSGRRFQLEVFVSPGGYICGEQTALIEAMENKRAEPRNRPPQLQTNGLYDQPTLLSNVETFAWVPSIVLRDAGQWFASQGKEGKGLRLLSISGDLVLPGVYEVPSGITIGELIDDFGGGLADGQGLGAIALSGPSGGLIPPRLPLALFKGSQQKALAPFAPDGANVDVRLLPLSIDGFRSFGLMFGAGIVIYGDRANLVSEALSLSRFFRNESCGKCVPCRIGSQKITEYGERIANGHCSNRELPILGEQIERLHETMTIASICGLGQVASNPMRTLLRYFPDLVRKSCQST
jgi:formate dehydrogenase beta subunit